MPVLTPEQSASCVDVLVLGAGLAGLRAGIAALEARPESSVLCCSLGSGAAGSSFANVNDALGMQVPTGAREQDTFVRRVLELGPPGEVTPELVRLMAQEALPRLEELLTWGVPFRQAGQGVQAVLQARVSGCFFQEQQSAAIFHSLGRAYAALAGRFRDLGGRLETNVSVQDLLLDSANAVQGGLLRRGDASGPVRQPARNVVLALGGPASLFGHNVCGPAVSGWSYALLHRAGAELRNAGFLQFMWYTLAPRRFLNLGSLAQQDWQVKGQDGQLSIPHALREHAQARGSHCPVGYGLPDAALDRFLLQQRDADGVVRLRPPGVQDWLEAGVFAHAGNGGAVIDAWGRTGVPGLHACGECATTMHGANRIGGGMVLATQVFGARAGEAAARQAGDTPEPRNLRPAGQQGGDTQRSRDPELMAWLRGVLSQHTVWAVCGSSDQPLSEVAGQLGQRQQQPLHPEDRLCLETASIMVEHLLQQSARGAAGA